MRNHTSKQKYYNNIFIIGMPGSGKSTFGHTYACFTGKKFLDFDDFFEKSAHMSIPKVFQSQGLQGFRTLESKILRSLSNTKNHVVALGGGTLLLPENFAFARQHGLIATLSGLSVEELAHRIWHDKINSKMRARPLFAKCADVEQVMNKLIELEKERTEVYEKADVMLNQKWNSTDNLLLLLSQAEQNFDATTRSVWKNF